MNMITKNSKWLAAGVVATVALTGSLVAQDAASAAKAAQAAANDAAAAAADAKFTVNNLWLLISAALVFIMHLGFSTLESGLTRKKNTVNILFKNVFIITSGILLYYVYGFNAHYPGDFNGFFAAGSPAGPGEGDQTSAYGDYTYWTDFIFQAMFAATAATIVSGAVAERIKLGKFMIFAVILVGFLYPLAGSWHWGGGFLAGKGFYDFAGSTVVHAFGGFAALACCIILGARKGKYTKDGIKPILGSSMPLATIGVLLLWFGWFGFNGGSVLNADPDLVSTVFTTTSLSACAGAIGAMLISAIFLKSADLSMALNGILAGLVGITAGPDVISAPMSIVVGLISGVIVVFSILFFDKIKIDDPVGAISVHGTCGIWGTLAVAIFGGDAATFGGQIIGIVSVCLFAFITSFVVFFVLKLIGGVRVSEEEEEKGLDLAEHGIPAYGAE
ncbi:MAG: ammonium transporter [Verrucomicrobiota bacterium]